jgi:hypothetical protein
MQPTTHHCVRRHSSLRRGGCLAIFGIVALILVILAAITAFVVGRMIHQQVDIYTSTSPVPVPKATISDADYAVVEQRVKTFRDALDNGAATDPLTLNERDLNAYLERSDPSGMGKNVYLTLDGSQIKGQVSLPLDDMNISWVKGRYLNGNVTLDVALNNGHLMVFAQQIEVNGKSPPDSVMKGFATKNLAENAMRDPKQAAAIDKLDSIAVKDGKLTVTAKPKAAP